MRNSGTRVSYKTASGPVNKYHDGNVTYIGGRSRVHNTQQSNPFLRTEPRPLLTCYTIITRVILLVQPIFVLTCK